jgi:hypothetical protein
LNSTNLEIFFSFLALLEKFFEDFFIAASCAITPHPADAGRANDGGLRTAKRAPPFLGPV